MLVNLRGRVTYAFAAGLCAAASSLFGKLSGIQDYSTCVGTVVYTSVAITPRQTWEYISWFHYYGREGVIWTNYRTGLHLF